MISAPLALLCRCIFIADLAILAIAFAVLAEKFPVPAAIAIGILLWRRARNDRRRRAGTAHGSARLADARDLLERRLLENDGLILGRASQAIAPTRGEALAALFQPRCSSKVAVAMLAGKRVAERFIRVRDYTHLATIAATGAGKGVAILIPNLLSHPGNCVVADPKAELFRITANHRKKKFKHAIARLDPFELAGRGGDSLNPVDLIDPRSPHLIDQCRDLASMLVVRNGDEREPHFNDMAELVLATFISYVAVYETAPEHRNLQTVRDLLCSPAKFAKALEMIRASDACGGLLRRLGESLGWLVDRELGSVLSTVQRHTAWLDSPAIVACTSRSSFDPRTLRTRRLTVYLCLPPDKLVSLAPLQRMWIGAIIRAVASGVPDERTRILFLLDEIGNIGRIQALEDAVTLLRGYGIRLWFFFQSLGQLNACFKENAAVVLDNVGTQQFFGLNHLDSADAVSRRLGDATIRNRSYQDNTSYSYALEYDANAGRSGQRSTGESVTVSELGRRLLTADEILRLPSDAAVIFHKNLPPIVARLPRHYDAPEFRRGRTGRSRGIGLAVLVRAVAWLAASLAIAVVAVEIPAPDPFPPGPTDRFGTPPPPYSFFDPSIANAPVPPPTPYPAFDGPARTLPERRGRHR